MMKTRVLIELLLFLGTGGLFLLVTGLALRGGWELSGPNTVFAGGAGLCGYVICRLAALMPIGNSWVRRHVGSVIFCALVFYVYAAAGAAV